jgi:hypothetical protein
VHRQVHEHDGQVEAGQLLQARHSQLSQQGTCRLMALQGGGGCTGAGGQQVCPAGAVLVAGQGRGQRAMLLHWTMCTGPCTCCAEHLVHGVPQMYQPGPAALQARCNSSSHGT